MLKAINIIIVLRALPRDKFILKHTKFLYSTCSRRLATLSQILQTAIIVLLNNYLKMSLLGKMIKWGKIHFDTIAFLLITSYKARWIGTDIQGKFLVSKAMSVSVTELTGQFCGPKFQLSHLKQFSFFLSI